MFQNTQPFGSSLFGGTSQQNNQTGGLFGNTNQAPPPNGGLFGSQGNNQGAGGSQAGSGLFGSLGNQTSVNPFGGLNNNQQGGLFSNPSNNQNNQGGSLFGNSQSSLLTGGGFGSLVNNQNSGSLFGNPSQNTFSSILGNQNNNTNNQNNLFGNTNNSLFGQNQQQNNSLFGSSNSNSLNKSFLGNSSVGISISGNISFGQGNNNVSLEKGSYGFSFYPVKVSDSRESMYFMSISVVDQFRSTSFDELRALDYIQKKSGQFSNLSTNNSIFGGNSLSTVNNNLFGGNQQSSLFQTSNSFQSNQNSLFGTNQNNTQKSNTLFGGANQNQQTSLFGNQSGSIFGNSSNQQQQQQGGLFGGTKPAITTNLFGKSENPTSNSLFGGGNNTGSLFGNTQSSQPQLSLFSNANTSQSSGGLFGQTQTSLFSQPQNSQNSQNSTSLFGNTSTQKTSTLFSSAEQSKPLFGGTSLFSQPPQNNQNSLFSAGINQPKTSLFGQPTQNTQQSSSLFGNNNQNSTNQGMSLFNNTQIPLFTSAYPSQLPVVPILQPIPFQIQNEALNQYIYGLQKTKTLNQIISELQSDYNDNKNKKDNELFSDHLNYDNFMSERLTEFKDFLKFKRTNNKIKNKKVETIPTPTEVSSFKGKDNNKTLFEPIRSDYFKKQRRDIVYKPKAHSCDMTKLKENIIISNLENTFNKHLIFEKLPPLRKKSEVTLIEIFIQILEPYKASFSLKISKNSKFSLLKSTICDKLKEKNKKYQNLTPFSFILMKKYSIVKETNTLAETDFEEGDTLFIILKECINKSDNESYLSNSDKKKTVKKSELAPIEKLPILTNSEYTIKPTLKDVSRMTVEELEHVENFSISNKNGKIEFVEPIDLTGVNLDQIVNIIPGKVELYKNNNISFLPQPGKGLNKKAIIHIYNCLEDNDKNVELSLAYQQEKTREVNGVFKSFDPNKKEYVYQIDHF